MSFKNCTQITPQCPLEATTYGYYPNLAGNTILCVVFGICFFLQIAFSIKGRTWTWLACLSIGCLMEMLGYVGRLLLHQNPWNESANRLQIITLILAPSFTSAGIDLILKYVVLYFGADASAIPARLYTWLFIGIDVTSILIQAAGGGMAASGRTNLTLLNAGNKVIIVGIALQVFQLALLGIMALYYAWNVHKRGYFSKTTGKINFFLFAVSLAYVCVLIRCIYRIPELAQGWGKGLQRDEVSFLVLDGAMIALANVALTIAHPAFFFPQMAASERRKQEAEKELSN